MRWICANHRALDEENEKLLEFYVGDVNGRTKTCDVLFL